MVPLRAAHRKGPNMNRTGILSKTVLGLAGLALVALSAPAGAAVIYTDRTTFENQLTNIITDGYDAADYTSSSYNDADMSAVIGETKYMSTGFTNLHLIVSGGVYCSGCNGSYLLDFTATSIGTSDGVFGVGLDVFDGQNVFGTTAFVTFGDGSTMNYGIPDIDAFWGITSDLLISTIHFGLVDGGTNTNDSVQRMAHDNLTIGTQAQRLPEPGSLAVFGLGLAGLGLIRRKRAKQ
jgi:hypothetical protein